MNRLQRRKFQLLAAGENLHYREIIDGARQTLSVLDGQRIEILTSSYCNQRAPEVMIIVNRPDGYNEFCETCFPNDLNTQLIDRLSQHTVRLKKNWLSCLFALTLDTDSTKPVIDVYTDLEQHLRDETIWYQNLSSDPLTSTPPRKYVNHRTEKSVGNFTRPKRKYLPRVFA